MKRIPFLLFALSLGLFTTAQAQTYRVLYNFGTTPGDPGCIEGPVSQSLGGNLYTTGFCDTSDPNGGGAAFMYRLSGEVDVLHRFAQGENPSGGLLLATNGYFYGERSGNQFAYGSIYKMSADGTVTTLYSFNGNTDGAYPVEGLVQSVSGDFYGITCFNCPYSQKGSIFKVTPGGQFTTLHTFSGPEGETPSGPLIQGSDYAFYGVASDGGKYKHGTIYKITSQGYLKVLYQFGAGGTEDAAAPVDGLTQASDGSFYGVTASGGPADYGTVYKLSPNGAFTIVHSFAGPEGAIPNATPVLATDGNLYGATNNGGAYGHGVIYRLTPSGTYTVLHSFSTTSSGERGMIQHTNGRLYGFLPTGGSGKLGVLYRVDLGLSPFVTYLNVWGRVGAHVTILGQGFTDSSIVSFNGTPAQDVAIHSTYIKATVPDGATTGPITVTTSSGTLTSNRDFVVH